MSIEETLSHLWKKNGFIPGGASWVAARFRIPLETAKAILERFERGAGAIEKPAPKPRQKRQPVITEIKADPHLLSVKQLKIMAYILALIAGVRSWVYVYEFYAKTDHFFLAAMMAALVVGATFVFPQIAVYAIKNKIKHRFKLSGAILILAVLSIGFSMVATVAGIYNARGAEFEKIASLEASQKNYAILLAGFEKDEKRLTDEMTTLQTDVKELKALRAVEKPFTWQYNSIGQKVDRKEKRISEISVELSEIASKKVAVSPPEYRDDFYGWLSGALGISRESLELIIAIGPALIVDLVGPIALGVGLFL
jgi:hypothetical protein